MWIKEIYKRLEMGILTVMGVVMSLVMVANSVLRYVFDSSLVWAEEFVRINFVWAMFIIITSSFMRREHIGFDSLMRKTPLGARMQEILYGVALSVIGGLMAWYGIIYNGFTGDVVLPATSLPASVLLLPGILAGAAWAVLGLAQIIRALQALFTEKE